MEEEGSLPPPPRGSLCFVVTIGPETAPAGAALVSELRAAGLPASSSYEERPLKAQLRTADRADAGFVAIVGAKELAEGAVTLRRLADGVQKTVPAADVVSWLTRLDGWTD